MLQRPGFSAFRSSWARLRQLCVHPPVAGLCSSFRPRTREIPAARFSFPPAKPTVPLDGGAFQERGSRVAGAVLPLSFFAGLCRVAPRERSEAGRWLRRVGRSAGPIDPPEEPGAPAACAREFNRVPSRAGGEETGDRLTDLSDVLLTVSSRHSWR